MKTLLPAIALVAAATLALAAAGETAGSAWIGKSRDEVVEKWGAPAKVKKQRDGEVLFFEREMLTGFAYGQTEASRSFEVDKDDEGKRRLKDSNPPGDPEPVYKKVKFRFFLDREGRVVRFEAPKVKSIDLSALPRPAAD